jgi:hypothetical protein
MLVDVLAASTVNVDPRLLIALIPLALIDVGMKIYCIVDLYKPDRRVRGNKIIWLLVILLVSTFGWLIYLLAAREEY